jgi:hypothetical protein
VQLNKSASLENAQLQFKAEFDVARVEERHAAGVVSIEAGP